MINIENNLTIMCDNKALIYKLQIGVFTNNFYKQVIGEYSSTANLSHVLSRIVKL